ncbi:winged helix-turn-helix domain-containing protein [Spirosoma areae]
MRKLAVIAALLVAGLLFTQFIWLAPAARPADNRRFGQKVNLALRRTAHHLLIENGDSTTRIAPVSQLNATTFVVRLEHPFDYGRLPALLQQSLAVHEINDSYDVAVLDCTTGELQLGYNFRDVTGDYDVPCGGRNQKQGCYTLQLTFAATAATRQSALLWWPWAIGFVLLGGAYVVWRETAGTLAQSMAHGAGHEEKWTKSLETPASESEPLLYVGNVSFRPANQSVNIGGNTYPLTYREAKLLHLFLRHPNQLLERDFILKSVWEDEGIIVGRSVDVFVSRLRKLLQPDPTVKLVAVHGVGYRLEVHP